MAINSQYTKPNNKIQGFLSGVFDMINYSHIQTFREAKSLCDQLIIGIENQKTAENIFGKNNIFNTQKNRIEVLKEIKSIDKIIVFKEELTDYSQAEQTFINRLKTIKPDILFISKWDPNLKNKQKQASIAKVKIVILKSNIDFNCW
jgi:cytidyltransferase-like protein